MVIFINPFRSCLETKRNEWNKLTDVCGWHHSLSLYLRFRSDGVSACGSVLLSEIIQKKPESPGWAGRVSLLPPCRAHLDLDVACPGGDCF